MKKIANKKPLIISNCIYALLLAVVIAVNCVAVYQMWDDSRLYRR